jgi:hypothetical protein
MAILVIGNEKKNLFFHAEIELANPLDEWLA